MVLNDRKLTAKQAKSRQKIIDAASRLIVEKGIENTSLADIARETDISKGTLYYYYASKDDLIFDLTERHMSRITSDLLNLIANGTEGVDATSTLRIVYETLVNAETRSRLHLYLVREALTGNEILRKRFLRKYQQWQSMLEDSIQKLIPGITNVKMKAQLIIASIDGYIIQSMLGNTDVPLAETAELLTKNNQ